jgi:hypothetical protein
MPLRAFVIAFAFYIREQWHVRDEPEDISPVGHFGDQPLVFLVVIHVPMAVWRKKILMIYLIIFLLIHLIFFNKYINKGKII